MTVYDKVSWQMEGGCSKEDSMAHISNIFIWLRDKKLLSDYGNKTFEEGIYIDSIISDEMLNDEGNAFFNNIYDKYIASEKCGNENIDFLDMAYNLFYLHNQNKIGY